MLNVTESDKAELLRQRKAEINAVPSPINVASTMLEAVTKVKTEHVAPKELMPKKYPTPGKKITSIGRLKKRIEQFFDEFYVPDNPKDGRNARKTVNDLALWLGYASSNSLYRAMASPEYPEYGEWLEYAVGRIEDKFEKDWLNKIEHAGKDSKGYEQYDKFLARQDRARERAMPKEDKSSLNVTVNIAKFERLDETIAKSVGALKILSANPDAKKATDTSKAIDVLSTEI
jgi:hypothetical protein